MTHPEIALEQAYLDRARDRLEEMRHSARMVASEVLTLGAGGTPANRLERDVRVELSERRLTQLRLGDAPVAFGRLDMADGETFYIGRIGISDAEGDPLVVDWRARVAEAFYRATATDPRGVSRRRHFLFRGTRLSGIDDELLSGEEARAGDLVLMGEAALIASLERGRTGRMGDIVSTIQAEQDAIIRSELSGALVVQGGAGTGKTAVALHRAAYLLFMHRLRLEREGMLLVGPNPVFLRYIDQVLPSLGEHTVALATMPELYAGGTRPAHEEPVAVAALKGDARMAAVIRRAVETRERPLRKPLVVELRGERVVVGTAEARRLYESTARGRGTHNARRAILEKKLAGAMVRSFKVAATRSAEAGRRPHLREEELTEVAAELSGELRRIPAVREALEWMWPVLTPEELLNDLLGAPALLRHACAGVLGEGEVELLSRPRVSEVAKASFSVSDMALLDEAAALLGPRRSARSRSRRSRQDGSDADSFMLERMFDADLPECPSCGSELLRSDRGERLTCSACGRSFAADELLGTGGQMIYSHMRARVTGSAATPSDLTPSKGARYYGHAVVDEAQNLSPMQWRSLARRVPSGSFTIVGDLGQATGARTISSWQEALAQLANASRGRICELSVNYRTPEEVMDLASPVLAAAAPALVPPRSARRAGVTPVFTAVGEHEVPPGDEALGLAVARAAEGERRAIGEGRVAVIAPGALVGLLASLLEVPHYEPALARASDVDRLLAAPVAVYGIAAARGLEFDSVVLVEPSALVEEEGGGADPSPGLRALYVAMTRTTRRLHVVHRRPLPPVLAAHNPPEG